MHQTVIAGLREKERVNYCRPWTRSQGRLFISLSMYMSQMRLRSALVIGGPAGVPSQTNGSAYITIYVEKGSLQP
jgi:hypothetical protein